MGETPPCVYILNGEDEFALGEFVARLQDKLGDPSMASVNTTRLDGRSAALNEIEAAAQAMPFLVSRRLVIVTNPLAKLNSPAARKKFLEMLAKIPPTTALVLVENRLLTEGRERRNGKLHWLEEWGEQAGERAFVRTFALPHGPAMAGWIQERAKVYAGQFTREAADRLAGLVGDEPRLADQEIQKLLAYANFTRPVEPDDVDALTPSMRQGDIFEMVDALGEGNGRRCQEMLHRLLKEQEAISILGMIVRQFRLLLLANEVLGQGGNDALVARELKIHPFVAGKVALQARHFTLPVLEAIYRRLLEVDEAIKSGQMEDILALDLLVARLTNQPAQLRR